MLEIQVSEDVNPWTHLHFLDNPDEFQFAIMSDRSGGTRIGVFARAVDKVNRLRPSFVICVGDLIDIYTDDSAELEAKWDQFDDMVDRLDMPFFYVVGNHDIYDEHSLEKWRQRLGRTYYHFVYRDVLFLVMDTEDPPPGGISGEQVQYIVEAIRANADVRWTLLLMHKPVWDEDEAGDLEAVETALSGRPYTVFAGHWHSYEKYVRLGTNYYRLATTGGASQLRGPANGEFDHIAWVTMTDAGPVVANLMLDGIDDDDPRTPPPRLSELLTFPRPVDDGPDLSVTLRAPHANISVDGDPADWSRLSADPVQIRSGEDMLACQIRYAWDEDNLFVLVEETPGDTTRVEADSGEKYMSPPFSWEGISLFMDLDNWPLYDGFVADFNPWFGFSSASRKDLFCARTEVTGAAECTQAIVPGLQLATSGRQEENDRVIEVGIPWQDLRTAVPVDRMRDGSFPEIRVGTRIGSEPLLLDDGYVGQRFLSGHRSARPTGRDSNSRDILLVE